MTPSWSIILYQISAYSEDISKFFSPPSVLPLSSSAGHYYQYLVTCCLAEERSIPPKVHSVCLHLRPRLPASLSRGFEKSRSQGDTEAMLMTSWITLWLLLAACFCGHVVLSETSIDAAADETASRAPGVGSAMKGSTGAPAKSVVNITAPQYCTGCRHTVDLYAQLTAKELEDLQRKGVKSGSTLDGQKVCRHSAIDDVIETVR
jgi:hypothetical protein